MNLVSGAALKPLKHPTYVFFVGFWPSLVVKCVYQATSSSSIHCSEVPVCQSKRSGLTLVHLLSFQFSEQVTRFISPLSHLKSLNRTAVSCVRYEARSGWHIITVLAWRSSLNKPKIHRPQSSPSERFSSKICSYCSIACHCQLYFEREVRPRQTNHQ